MKNLFDLLNKSPFGQFVVAIIAITSAVITGFKTLFAQTSEPLPFNGPLWLNALAIFGLVGTILLIIGFAMPEMTRRNCHTGAVLTRLSQFAAILAYFCAKTAFKSNGFIKCISKSVAVKTYPLAKA